MDALKIELRAVDEIQPLVADVATSLNRLAGLPKDFPPSLKIQEWLRLLNGMRAVEEIDEDQGRQLMFDLDNCYAGFHKFLKEERK